MKLEYIVNKLTKYKTVKQVLKEEFLLSDRLIIKLKKSKQIYLNGYPVFINETVKLNDKIEIDLDSIENAPDATPAGSPLLAYILT